MHTHSGSHLKIAIVWGKCLRTDAALAASLYRPVRMATCNGEPEISSTSCLPPNLSPATLGPTAFITLTHCLLPSGGKGGGPARLSHAVQEEIAKNN